ncbi:MAG: heme exporter protein CcmD [Halioglobus sp.]
MYFDSVSAAIDMAGHGGYVWSAYFISLLVIAYLLVLPGLRQRSLKRQIAGELRREAHAAALHSSEDPAVTSPGEN